VPLFIYEGRLKIIIGIVDLVSRRSIANLQWAWRSAEAALGAKRVKLTPKLTRPKKSPSCRFSLPATR